MDFEKTKHTTKAHAWVQEFDDRSPWVLRLLLVTAILLLSMLVL